MPQVNLPERLAFDDFVFSLRAPQDGEPEIERRSYPWGDTPDTYHFGGREIQIGDRFQRQSELLHADGSVARQVGAWEFWRSQGDPGTRHRSVRVNIERTLTTTPGANMNDPDGIAIWILNDEGKRSRPKFPAVGEQDRDPWDGGLLFVEDETGALIPLVVAE